MSSFTPPLSVFPDEVFVLISYFDKLHSLA